MKTIFITGHDTGIGKTWVTQYIAKRLSEKREHVQVIKAVETGIQKNIEVGDIIKILKDLNLNYVNGYTLNSFEAPLAPCSAAQLEGKTLTIKEIYKQINALPTTDWRLIESAGGIAVPLDTNGQDGRDLAVKLKVDYMVLVIQNRLGAINQGRLIQAYLSKEFKEVGFWLNDTQKRESLVTQSNLRELNTFKTPIWAHHGFEQEEPDFCYAPFLSL